VDYKTGRYRQDDYEGTFMGGRLLQHALYALAARELIQGVDPRARVGAGSYYFPTSRGRGERVVLPQGDPAAVVAVLRDLFEVVACGTFVHSSDESDCRWCEFGRACGADPVARAKRKIEHGDNEILDAYRRLARHE
jgi:ATP-dependent helicase/nuclease subunit B